MKHFLIGAAALALTLPAFAQESEPEGAPSPNAIVDAAPASEWVAIPADDLLVMTLSPGSNGLDRQVVMQLMPAPFSQGWVENIRTLARAGWYDGISVNRVQDNYVVQWGDPNVDNPEADDKAKPLPEGLRVMAESDYLAMPDISPDSDFSIYPVTGIQRNAFFQEMTEAGLGAELSRIEEAIRRQKGDSYAMETAVLDGWPMGMGPSPEWQPQLWPVHCYGMVGVGRSYAPDTGSGAELYTVIGHAPRHLDRNIALVGRVIEGIEHLSSLPRGTGPLGFYETAEERVPIQNIRVASDLADGEIAAFEYLSTDGETFARYADARANRRDPFFITPAGGADICNIPVPVRRVVDAARE